MRELYRLARAPVVVREQATDMLQHTGNGPWTVWQRFVEGFSRRKNSLLFSDMGLWVLVYDSAVIKWSKNGFHAIPRHDLACR
jgi:hypothetical protein